MTKLRQILVGQSGGPTAAINASLAGVIAAAHASGAWVSGMRYGIKGFLEGRVVDLSARFDTDEKLEQLRRTPSSWLGSCRFKLPEPNPDDNLAADFYEEAFERLEAAHADAVLYIGGNDSMDTIAKLSAWGEHARSPIRFIGVPKTIDNDLAGTDHTPGYGSAARLVATALQELARDADVYDLKSVTFVEIMGRDSGWLAGAACLARPDLILLPEVPLGLDDLMARLHELLATKNTVVVAVSEGVRTADGRLVAEGAVAPGTGVDEFGHLASLGGAGRVLSALARERLGCKTRAVELSTLQRCAGHCASEQDLTEAYALGRVAVDAAEMGLTGQMCAIERRGILPYHAQTATVDVRDVANKVRSVPRRFITEDGMNVTREFALWVEPLVGELPRLLEPLR